MESVTGNKPYTPAETLTTAQAQALFAHWRLVLMGHQASRKTIPQSVAGYFCREGDPRPLPLALTRRELLAAVDRTPLSDEERSVVQLYYGLHGLPLPFGSKRRPDIAAGRDESSPRGTCRSALAKIAQELEPRPLVGVARRPTADPLRQPWFLRQAPGRKLRRDLIARAFVKAVSMCDGPHAPPTLAALGHWYRNCGYADPHLIIGSHKPARPNAIAKARAISLMEIYLFEEVHQDQSNLATTSNQLPCPRASEPSTQSYPETVGHPDLVAILDGDVSPAQLVRAAARLQEMALNAQDVTGQTALLLRTVRPRLRDFTRPQLERLAVSFSYVATTMANPFLALEWLGHFLTYAGITDRVFTVLVNTIEAAACGGYHQLAERGECQFLYLRAEWKIPDGQIPSVEHTEAEQQRMVAGSFRLQRKAMDLAQAGAVERAIVDLEHSVRLGVGATRLAQRVLTDSASFPPRPLPGKAGHHGGDLTAPWLLAAAARSIEPACHLAKVLTQKDQWTPDRRARLKTVGQYSRTVLPLCQHLPDTPGYQYWHELVATQSARLIDA